MPILFRCPECDHKLRASGSAAGRRSRCKCGAIVTIPVAETVADASLSATMPDSGMQLPMADDLCEAITAWSPLCAAIDESPQHAANRPGAWLIALGGFVAVLVVGILILAFGWQGDDKGRAVVKGADRTEFANPPEPGQETPRPPKVQPAIKPVSKEPARPEIVEWYTTSRLSVIDEQGMKEELFLEDKEGTVVKLTLVIVKVRMPADLLAGREFDVRQPDVHLRLPSTPKLVDAMGCGIGKEWFAPPSGKSAYLVPRTGLAVQGWLFFAPVNDLVLGRTMLQFRGRDVGALTARNRRQSAQTVP